MIRTFWEVDYPHDALKLGFDVYSIEEPETPTTPMATWVSLV
jgi:hypothetical protein